MATTPTSGPINVWIAVIGGLAVLLGAIIAGYFTLWGSAKNASVIRANAIDKRSDEQLDDALARAAALEQAKGVLELTVHDLTNRLIVAHYILADHKIDPRILDEPEAGHGRRPH